MLFRRPVEAVPPQPLQNSSRVNAADKISITRIKYNGRGPRGHRIWTVLVAVNEEEGVPKTLTDPFTEAEYSSRTKSASGIVLDTKSAEDYFNKLVSQLGLESVARQGRPHRQISIHEELNKDNKGNRGKSNEIREPSIYCLLWEVLERVNFWQHCALTSVKLCRTWTCDAAEAGLFGQQVRRSSRLPTHGAEYRILLVIARSFRQSQEDRYCDYRPGVVLGPLLKIAAWCNQRDHLPRVRVDVVRPGTFGELKCELERNKGRPYDIVHLDMHGKIDKSATPYLRFAKHYREDLRQFYVTDEPITALMGSDDSLRDIRVVEVAALLQRYGITKVALSACLSSYAQGDMLANMCHLFLSHGASHVSAMSFQVLQNTAQIYYAAFYEALLVNGQSLLSAAADGRAALRADRRQLANALVPTSYHRITRVTTNDFWPRHMHAASLSLIVAYCLRLAAILGLTSALLPFYLPASACFRLSGGGIRCLSLSTSLASIIWYGSIRWVQRLHCPLWLWMPRKVFHEGENLARLSHVEIEHLVLEDRLESEANQRAIYLWSQAHDTALGSVVARLARVWVQTGFVESIVVIPAMVFTSPFSSLHYWLRMWITHYRSHLTGDHHLPPKRLVVITDFRAFYEVYRPRGRPPLPGLQDALRRMSDFVDYYEAKVPDSDVDELSVAGSDAISDMGNEDLDANNTETGRTYLIITGSFDDTQWAKLEWYEPKIIETIGRAVPHAHNVQPSQ
ncbi:hypothetical protein CC86DRAFT_98122 [Ophiobolus disseminans]|uniref:CHAT domain-containing protein n=1 Tax=Ophiobolus disseminans TaxID=1469910 RepID=A0A6A6ZN86_9PLEO|nr:hypothetical protein CC86DRAFT_98122 [Ophiobolus disseminans]